MAHETPERDKLELAGADQTAPGMKADRTATQSVEDNAGTPASPPDEREGEEASSTGLSEFEVARLSQDIVAALKTVYDPEIPADIYELGLIYRVEVSDDRDVEVDMTLTAPNCPVAGEMPEWVQNAVASVPGVGSVKVNLTFDPPWDMSRMSDEARLALNMF